MPLMSWGAAPVASDNVRSVRRQMASLHGSSISRRYFKSTHGAPLM